MITDIRETVNVSRIDGDTRTAGSEKVWTVTTWGAVFHEGLE